MIANKIFTFNLHQDNADCLMELHTIYGKFGTQCDNIRNAIVFAMERELRTNYRVWGKTGKSAKLSIRSESDGNVDAYLQANIAKAQKQLQRVNVLARVLNSIIRAAFANGFIQQLNQTA